MKYFGLIATLLLACSLALAEPSTLTVRKNVKNMSSRSYIVAVHQEIPTRTGDLAQIRLAIIEGMLNTKGRAWTYEGEEVRPYTDPLPLGNYVEDVDQLLLETVFESGCGDNCRHLGEENVIQWIVNLRRTIAYVLTTKIRDQLREQPG